MLRFWSAGSPSVLEKYLYSTFKLLKTLIFHLCFCITVIVSFRTTPPQIMDALSTEWRSGVQYATGNRVAFKITGSLGVAAFECLQSHISSSDNQPTAGSNAYWKHYPRGFPRS